MNAIPSALRAVPLFLAPPAGPRMKAAVRRSFDCLRTHYEGLRRETGNRVKTKAKWLVARWVRNWHLNRGLCVAGSRQAPNTVWELVRALKRLDPHAEVLVGDPGSRTGHSKPVVAPDIPTELGAVALMPARFP